MRDSPNLYLAMGLLSALAIPQALAARGAQEVPAFRSGVDGLRTRSSPSLVAKQEGCVAHLISCGETVASQITSDDCVADLPETIFFDVFFFDGAAGTTITATLSSEAFDPFLVLFDPQIDAVAEDDDGGPGNAAQIVFNLDETSPSWSLSATPLEPLVTGPYTLSLECTAPSLLEIPTLGAHGLALLTLLLGGLGLSLLKGMGPVQQ